MFALGMLLAGCGGQSSATGPDATNESRGHSGVSGATSSGGQTILGGGPSGGAPNHEVGDGGAADAKGEGGAWTQGAAGAAAGGRENVAGSSSGAGAKNSCRTSAECPPEQSGVRYECVGPGEFPEQPAICGAPAWCGACVCPPEPPPVQGGNTPCKDASDCPAKQAGARTASLCGAQNLCVECVADGDCGGPGRCVDNQCVECLEDSDCGGGMPFCIAPTGFVPSTPGGQCLACRANADCETGVCSGNLCLPECTTDAACGPLRACVRGRCGPEPCQNAADCGDFGECTSGGCTRKTCSSDADCAANHSCVHGACFDGPGRCAPVYTLAG